MTTPPLFQPYNLGPFTLTNHIVMAPLTRNRAGAGRKAEDERAFGIPQYKAL